MRLRIYAKIRFGYFLACVLALSSVICWPIHLFTVSCGFQKVLKKGFIKKII